MRRSDGRIFWRLVSSVGLDMDSDLYVGRSSVYGDVHEWLEPGQRSRLCPSLPRRKLPLLVSAHPLNPSFQYIIMAMYANPKPDNPYQPLPPSEHHTDTIFPSPFIPIRIPFFAPVIWLNDQVANVLDFTTGGRKGRRPSGGQQARAMEGVEEGVGYRSGGKTGFRVRKDARKLD
jgi:hypothetical protein